MPKVTIDGVEIELLQGAAARQVRALEPRRAELVREAAE
jgi:hypothetical protein